jgi:AcrR family transcriptional regulator
MGVQPQPHKRAELLDALTTYALTHGISGVSLRDAASAVGTNARMLVYHFGSRDQLVVELLERARGQQEDLLRAAIDDEPELGTIEKLTRIWHTLSSKRHEGYARLFFEAYGLGIQGRPEYSVALKGTVTFLHELVEGMLVRDGMVRPEARAFSSMIAAGLRGFVLDVLATGDRTRVNAAAYRLFELVQERIGKAKG